MCTHSYLDPCIDSPRHIPTDVFLQAHTQPQKYYYAYLAPCPPTSTLTHRVACGMPRGADWGNKLMLERQLVQKAQTEEKGNERQPGGLAGAKTLLGFSL